MDLCLPITVAVRHTNIDKIDTEKTKGKKKEIYGMQAFDCTNIEVAVGKTLYW